ncbi:MAG: phosphoribosylglycinamide formyltransferase [Planctomycetes bacterium]|nr:phosphoribosylglycinamide formyltransferase [Planctomycetota bacterium]
MDSRRLWRAAILVSGGGTNALNLLRASRAGEIPVVVAAVIAHRADIPAVERCRSIGVEPIIVTLPPGDEASDAIDAALRSVGTELVLLAGYLRYFRVGPWGGRTLNIHPALLPSFGGRGMFGEQVHAAVLQRGERESGCTVHFVDHEYDHGATLVQRRVPVLDADTPRTLAARVQQEESAAYCEAIRLWASRQQAHA